MAEKSCDPNFHLLRVRIKKSHFDALKIAAERETVANESYTTVSDIVRSALLDWFQEHSAPKRSADQSRASVRSRFVPSNLAVEAATTEDEQLSIEAEVSETAAALVSLDQVLAASLIAPANTMEIRLNF